MTARVAIVCERFGAAKAMEAVLAGAGCEVALATRERDVLALARTDACDIVILRADSRCPGPLDLCPRLKAERPDLSVLAIACEADAAMRLRALDAGADEVANSGLSGVDLILRTQSLAGLKAVRDEARRLAAVSNPAIREDEFARGRVLVLDSNERSRTRLAQILGDEFAVTALSDPTPGLIGVAEGGFDVAWLGDETPGWESSRLARQLRLVDPACALRVLLVADADASLRLRGLQESGIDDTIRRPVDRSETLTRTRVAVTKRLLLRAERARAPTAARMIATRFRPHGASPGRFAA